MTISIFQRALGRGKHGKLCQSVSTIITCQDGTSTLLVARLWHTSTKVYFWYGNVFIVHSLFPFQIHIVDGARLVESPWEEMMEIENFLRIPNQLSESNFFLNKAMGVWGSTHNYSTDMSFHWSPKLFLCVGSNVILILGTCLTSFVIGYRGKWECFCGCPAVLEVRMTAPKDKGVKKSSWLFSI